MVKCKYHVEDYIGKKFGKWTILRKMKNDVHGHTMVECRCDCGKIDTVRLLNILNGGSTQCVDCRIGSRTNRNHESLDYELSTDKERFVKKGLFKNNRSGYNGIGYYNSKWRVQITSKNKNHHLGTYSTQREALSVLNAYIILNCLPHPVQKYHGEVVIVNDEQKRVQEKWEKEQRDNIIYIKEFNRIIGKDRDEYFVEVGNRPLDKSSVDGTENCTGYYNGQKWIFCKYIMNDGTIRFGLDKRKEVL